MGTLVRQILNQIQRLPDRDRLELRCELARQDEHEWSRLSAEARATARQRGIDDAAIVHAVQGLRYPDERPPK